MHDTLSTELTPGVAFYADITSRTTFAGGSKGKTLLVNFVSTAKLIKSGFGEGGFQLAGTFSLKMLKVSMLIHSESHSVCFFCYCFFWVFCKLMYSIPASPTHTCLAADTSLIECAPCCASCLCKVACLLCVYSSVFALGVLSV